MAPRFFMPVAIAPSDVGADVMLPDTVAHHAIRVLRLAKGDAIVLFDGRGGEYAATLVAIGKREARARVERFAPVERECPHAVTLVQAVIASDPMEIVVRKAVELGARAIAPVLAARSQGPRGSEKRLAHWRAVAVAACEQCGRNRVPPIDAPMPLQDWLGTRPSDAGPAVMLGPGGDRSLASVVRARLPRYLLVGPEGGWTGEELAAATTRDVAVAHLGPRVLRAETAAVAALATVNAIVGDEG